MKHIRKNENLNVMNIHSKAVKNNGSFIVQDDEAIVELLCDLPNRDTVFRQLDNQPETCITVDLSDIFKNTRGYLYKFSGKETNNLVLIYSEIPIALVRFFLEEATQTYQMNSQVLQEIVADLLDKNLLDKLKRMHMTDVLDKLHKQFNISIQS